MIGATRESVNKWLRSWEEDGVVELGRARVRILDPAKLVEIGTYTGL
jgi:CRP-like cAMP-binding protein